MNLSPYRRLRLSLFPAALAVVAAGQKLDFSGQASGWMMLNRDTSYQVQAGLRYIPSLSMALPPYLDAEVSVNAFASALARSLDSIDTTDVRVKPYRAWARFSTARFEARAGLQKVNFGSATLLRPLMWFDRVDPRDPLELTDGVYGLLARYYFQNNANIWAWGLIGNSAPKGWEFYSSERWTPEFGGRAQLPVPRGEVGITVDHRTASVVWRELPALPPETCPATEARIGLDGRWDVEVGLWFEATMGEVNSDYVPYRWQRAATVGVDYTFGIGNGLGVLAEHLVFDNAPEAFGAGERVQASAAMASYPLGMLDNLRAIALYDWHNKGIYRFVGWQRTLDNWLFSATAFWNPDSPASLGVPGGGAAGKGIQLMVVFNH